MAVYVLGPMRFARLEGLESIPIAHGREGAGQTFKTGEVLIWSAGLLVAAGASPVAAIAGVALQDASGVTGTDTMFVEARQGCLFEITLDGSVSPGHVLVVGDRGAKYNLKVTTHQWWLDADVSAAPGMVVAEFAPGFLAGDVLARVYARFIPTVETP